MTDPFTPETVQAFAERIAGMDRQMQVRAALGATTDGMSAEEAEPYRVAAGKRLAALTEEASELGVRAIMGGAS